MPKPLTKTPETGGAPAPSAPPGVLGSTKQMVDSLLGRPVMARGLMGLTAQGEKSYAYSQGADEILVGFFGDVARYLAVVRSEGPKSAFSPAEVASILALNGPPSLWKSEKADIPAAGKPAKPPKKTGPAEVPSTYFSFTGKDGEIVGWQPGDKPFVFFLLPTYAGQPHLLINEWQIARAIG